jgi:hypothetical protein
MSGKNENPDWIALIPGCLLLFHIAELDHGNPKLLSAAALK